MQPEKTPDIISFIAEEIETDEWNDSAKLIELYKNATTEEKDVIDRFMLDLCGWQFPTALMLTEDRGYYVED